MKAMKTKMLIFVFLLGITDLFAQTLYVPGTIVKGKNASYYCAFENKLVVRVYNVNNVDTTTTMYYDDGTVVPYYVGLGGTIATETEDLVRVFQETLTQEERNILTIKVKDYSDTYYYSRGKQKLENGGMFYTAQSGIWQTVWMEKVPEYHIKDLKITPLYDQSSVMIQLEDAAGRKDIDYDVTVTARTMWPLKTAGRTGRPCMVRIPHMRNWSPEDPFLYDVHIKMGNDSVESYFAMRKIEVKNDKNGIPRIFLNNKPYFQKGVLDQGYWPDGLYTAPSDEALIYDIQTMKNLGFNMLRKHIKVEPMRWYYHCDRLGMLVWQDMPSGGGQYNLLTISAPLITGVHLKDSHYRLFARTDAEGRDSYTRELEELVAQLQNCPCIVLWVLFNEGWGQFDAKNAVRLLRRLDPTRLIDHASGWHDQGVSDVKSLHVYFKPYRFKPDKKGRAVVLSEFGGYNLPVAGHTWNAKNFGYKGYQTPEALGEAVKTLYETQIVPACKSGLAADVYTQLSDVEDEVNGFVTYDRRVEKLPEALMRAIARELKED